jgi:hypothetical protein
MFDEELGLQQGESLASPALLPAPVFISMQYEKFRQENPGYLEVIYYVPDLILCQNMFIPLLSVDIITLYSYG